MKNKTPQQNQDEGNTEQTPPKKPKPNPIPEWADGATLRSQIGSTLLEKLQFPLKFLNEWMKRRERPDPILWHRNMDLEWRPASDALRAQISALIVELDHLIESGLLLQEAKGMTLDAVSVLWSDSTGKFHVENKSTVKIGRAHV